MAKCTLVEPYRNRGFAEKSQCLTVTRGMSKDPEVVFTSGLSTTRQSQSTSATEICPSQLAYERKARGSGGNQPLAETVIRNLVST